MTSWRDRCRPIIAEVLHQTRGESEANIRRALRAAFPFGPQEYFPYRQWLAEVRIQRGKIAKIKDAEPMALFESQGNPNA